MVKDPNNPRVGLLFIHNPELSEMRLQKYLVNFILRLGFYVLKGVQI